MLARREHSRAELQRKLISKGWDSEQVRQVLDELAAENLQDDDRFMSAYIRYRSEAGYGPRRIMAELAERGIKEVTPDLTDANSPEWLAVLKRAWQKKFNNEFPKDFKTKAKQMRFLIYRGFTPDQADCFLKKR